MALVPDRRGVAADECDAACEPLLREDDRREDVEDFEEPVDLREPLVCDFEEPAGLREPLVCDFCEDVIEMLAGTLGGGVGAR